MSISIVTVTLNAASDLPLTIESVAQQDYEHVEFIVVDGGSRDGTDSVLERYRDCIDRVLHVEDAGIFFAMNHALDHCRNDFVLFLNAGDTLFATDTLSVMMACRRPDTDVFFGNHVYLDGKREFFKRSLDFGILAERLLHGDIDHRWLSSVPGHQATFMRVDLLRRLRFDTAIEICADHDVLMRAFQAGADFQFIDQTVSHYVAGGYSTRHPNRLALEWCTVYRAYSLRPADVDAFFLGTTTSPFGTQNALTGLWLSGNDLAEEADIERGIEKPVYWCRPDGVRLLAPRKGESTGIAIEGFNPFQHQRLLFFVGDSRVGEANLDAGWFTVTIDFAVALAPGSVVELLFARWGERRPNDACVVGGALASFAFRRTSDVAAPPLRLGEMLNFSAANAKRTRAMMGIGWSNQEPEHVWTVGAQAELTLRVAPAAQELTLRCRANPYIMEASERGIEVSINDVVQGIELLPLDETVTIKFDLSPEQVGSNLRVILRPLMRMSPPDDERKLGLCLFAIGCR